MAVAMFTMAVAVPTVAVAVPAVAVAVPAVAVVVPSARFAGVVIRTLFRCHGFRNCSVAASIAWGLERAVPTCHCRWRDWANKSGVVARVICVRLCTSGACLTL